MCPAWIDDLKALTADPGLALTSAQSGPDESKTLVARYDFSKLGGAIGTVSLVKRDGTTPATLPAKALIVSSFIHTQTVATSGGAGTLSIGDSSGAAAIQAAAAVSGAPYSTLNAFVAASVQNHRAAAAGAVTGTIATAALTAGVIDTYIDYYQGS